MIKYDYIIKSNIILLLMLLLMSCEKENSHDLEPPFQKMIYLFVAEEGVDDLGYNHLIYEGFLEIAKELDLRLVTIMPNSMEEAEDFFSYLLNESESEEESLIVLSKNEYLPLVHNCIPADQFRDDVLIFEYADTLELPCASFSTTSFGVSYMAGALATEFGHQSGLIVGNSSDPVLHNFINGFELGVSDNNGSKPRVEFLADTWEGHFMEQRAYELTAEMSKQCSFIFPLAGKSSLGVYRYTRDYPGDVYVAGIDTDQSALSPDMPFSVVKYIDVVIKDVIREWNASAKLPQKEVYGLNSNYVDVIISEGFEYLTDEVEKYRKIAIEKENELIERDEK